MRYFVRVRKNREARSERFESDNIKELWYLIYSHARRVKREGAMYVTFRIRDREDRLKKYARICM